MKRAESVGAAVCTGGSLATTSLRASWGGDGDDEREESDRERGEARHRLLRIGWGSTLRFCVGLSDGRKEPALRLAHATTCTAGLYAVPFDARRLRVNGSPTLIAEYVFPGSGGAAPVVVADNGTLAFIQGRDIGASVQPVIVNRAGVQRSLGVGRGSYRDPRVSPDGRQVAYSFSDATAGANLGLGTRDVWRADVATGRAQRVTTNGASGGDFLMLAERDDTTKVHMPLAVRLNWASSLEERGVARPR